MRVQRTSHVAVIECAARREHTLPGPRAAFVACNPRLDLAARVGFRSNSHFTVWFKRRTGASPDRHRHRHARA